MEEVTTCYLMLYDTFFQRIKAIYIFFFRENDPKHRQCVFRPISSKLHEAKGQITAVRTCNSYWNSADIMQEGHGVEELILGMSKQVTEREDHVITEDLRGFVSSEPQDEHNKNTR